MLRRMLAGSLGSHGQPHAGLVLCHHEWCWAQDAAILQRWVKVWLGGGYSVVLWGGDRLWCGREEGKAECWAGSSVWGFRLKTELTIDVITFSLVLWESWCFVATYEKNIRYYIRPIRENCERICLIDRNG